jgi:predicted flavoprotein YhiN
MNKFTLEDSREIQKKLKSNKAKYDQERLREWKERKSMKTEDENLKAMFLDERSKNEQQRMEEEIKETREAELNEKWKKFMLETEIEKQQIIEQLTEAAVLRGTKGKGKKKGKKKK